VECCVTPGLREWASPRSRCRWMSRTCPPVGTVSFNPLAGTKLAPLLPSPMVHVPYSCFSLSVWAVLGSMVWETDPLHSQSSKAGVKMSAVPTTSFRAPSFWPTNTARFARRSRRFPRLNDVAWRLPVHTRAGREGGTVPRCLPSRTSRPANPKPSHATSMRTHQSGRKLSLRHST